MFSDLVSEQGHSCMFYGDLVKGFEAVDNAECLAILLDYTKPAGSVGRVRRLIYSSINLLLNELAYFFVDAWQDWDVLLCSGLVWDCQDLDRGEEVFMKVASFEIVPSKT